MRVSTHSRPKAAGLRQPEQAANGGVSTHSRPKAAGRIAKTKSHVFRVSTHSRPKAAGWVVADLIWFAWFQLTAARRRLVLLPPSCRPA